MEKRQGVVAFADVPGGVSSGSRHAPAPKRAHRPAGVQCPRCALHGKYGARYPPARGAGRQWADPTIAKVNGWQTPHKVRPDSLHAPSSSPRAWSTISARRSAHRKLTRLWPPLQQHRPRSDQFPPQTLTENHHVRCFFFSARFHSRSALLSTERGFSMHGSAEYPAVTSGS